MERKLTLADIAGYIPYRLYAKDAGWYFQTMPGIINHVMGIRSPAFQVEGHEDKLIVLENLKPVLRPLSDLYRTITHNGKELVPIVELCETALQSTVDNYELKKDNLYIYIADRLSYEFCFSKERGSFEFVYIGKVNNLLKVNHQNLLFDYLHELKIDYRDLIEAKLAVSCCDLKTNPYK